MTKCQIIKTHRYINVEGVDWWDEIYTSFRTDMAAVGIRTDMVYYSMFWPTDDEVRFDVWVVDWELFLRSLGYDNPVLVDHAECSWSFSVRGYYQRGDRFDINSEMPYPTGRSRDDARFIRLYSPYPEGDIRSHAWLAILRSVNYDELANDCIEVFKTHMRDLYRRLEVEYEHLTSDEAVWGAIVANGLDRLDEK